MLMPKHKVALLAALGLCLLPLTPSAFADTPAGTTTTTTTTTKPVKEKKVRTAKAPKAKTPELPKRTAAMLERINGKPLTEEQKTAALQAQNDYTSALKALDAKRDADFATALGLTADEYTTKAKSSKSNSKVTAPATTPTATTPTQ